MVNYYYIYNNKELEQEYIEYFKKNNFVCINNINIENHYFEIDDIIVFSNYINKKYAINCDNKILFINREIINTNLISDYKYYVPLNFMLFEKYLSILNFNLLPPINIIKNSNFKLMLNDKSKKIFKNFFDEINIDNVGNIILYSDIEDLIKISINNKTAVRYNEKNFMEQYINIKNINCIINKKYENNYFNKIVNLENINTEKKIITYNPLERIRFKKNVLYIVIRKGFNSYISYETRLQYFNILKNLDYNCVLFKVNGLKQVEFGIFYYSQVDITMTLKELLNKVVYFDSRYIGYNNIDITLEEKKNLYYCYGLFKLFNMITEFKHIYNIYLEIIISFIHKVKLIKLLKFNKDKFIKILFFWSGLNNYYIRLEDIEKFINNNEEYFKQEKILLVSKNINSYGGNQKTAIQVYNEFMIKGYDVIVFCPSKDKLVDAIDLNDILLLDKVNNLVNYIESNNFKLILVNKLNEYIDISKNIKIPQILITHNSMDPINEIIVSNSKFITKTLTVNTEHISLLYENKIKCPVEKYINYQENKNYVLKKSHIRNEFKKLIVFIGRLSSEKNVNLLVQSFLEFDINKEYKLYIIGDGKFEVPYYDDNILFLGKLTMDNMIFYLLNCDYLVLPSFTEGLPFCIIEALSLGIPVITSNINGCREIITNNYTGFTFDIHNYNEYKNIINNFKIIEEQQKYFDFNKINLINCLKNAYSIPIDNWNMMSKNCIDYIDKMYNIENAIDKNINNIINIKNNLLITNSDTNNLLTDFFDINETNRTYELVLKIDDIKLLLNRIIGENIYLLMAKLNYIKNEMIDKSIHKIIDKENNYILVNNYNLKDEKKIDNIITIFL